jgi:cyclopropane fatty-acyl-phospholipid synthase-like methyltransferase
LWESKRKFQKDFLLRLGLQPHHRLLDFGCGTLRGGLPLIEYLDEGNYVGLDVRTETMREACLELEESGLARKRPTIIHAGDLSLLSFGHRFEFIWAFSVLIHLDDSDLARTLNFVARNLLPDGAFFANVNVGSRTDGRWREFPLVWRSHEFYKRAYAQHGLDSTDIGALREYGHTARTAGEEDQLSQRMLQGRLLPIESLGNP